MERGQGKTGRRDLLEHFLDAKNPDGTSMTSEEVKGECLLVMIAGADTTATTLRHLIFYLLRKPDAFEMLKKQVDAAYEGGRFSKPVPRNVEVEKEVPFLSGCILEALRLSSPVAAMMCRIVGPEPLVLSNGMVVPVGAEVGMNPWVVHRHKGTWGPDAEEFRPERWEIGETKRFEMERNMIAFGGGARVCLGKNIALLEIAKVTVELVRRFDMKIVGPPEGKNYNEWRWNTGTWNEKGFWMEFERRKVPEWEVEQ